MSLNQSVSSTVDKYIMSLHKGLSVITEEVITPFIDVLEEARQNKTTVYLCGNGGSAANASHMALHLQDVGIKALSLTDNTPRLTANANDFGYDEIFKLPLEYLAKPKDVLIIISGSGQSWNLMKIFDKGNIECLHGMAILALLGMDGGYIPSLAKVYLYEKPDAFRYYSIIIPEMTYGPIEDAHSAIIHIVHERLQELRGFA